MNDASGKCDACMHLLHYIPPTPETYWARSFFKFDLCITDLDGVTDTDGEDDGEDDSHDSFFSSKPVMEDLGHSEGMLLVNVNLSGAANVTHIM